MPGGQSICYLRDELKSEGRGKTPFSSHPTEGKLGKVSILSVTPGPYEENGNNKRDCLQDSLLVVKCQLCTRKKTFNPTKLA